MREILQAVLLLIIGSVSLPVIAQGCAPGPGVNCTPNIDLWVPEINSSNWGVFINADLSLLDSAYASGLGFPFTLGSTSIAGRSTTSAISGLTLDGVSPTTFGYVDPTSSIQTQLNGKQSTIVLTTNGSSGPSTWNGSILNIPQYSGGDSITSPNSTITVGGSSTATTIDLNLTHVNTWTAVQTQPAPILSNVTGLTQCLHVNSSGQISGTGSDCGGIGGTVSASFIPYASGSNALTNSNYANGNLDAGSIYNAIVDGGATGNGTTDDTAALTAGCKAATGAGKIFYLPGNTFKVTGTVTCNPSGSAGNVIRVQGVPYVTQLVSTSSTADIMHLGNNHSCGGLTCGYIEGVNLVGPTSTPAQNGQRALLLDDLTQFTVDTVNASDTDIAFDAINDCYGARFINDRAGFFGNNNVGLYMRTGSQSGNQWFVRDSWISGKLGAVYMAGGADGLYIQGGQFSMPNTTTSTQAVFMLGIDYLTSALAGVGNIEVDGIDTEQAGGWWIFSQGTVGSLKFSNSDFYANGTNATEGVLKATNAATSSFTFTNNLWGVNSVGGYAAPEPITISGDYGNTFVQSTGWNGNAGGLSFNGVAWQTNYGFDPCVISNTLSASIGVHCAADYRPYNSALTTHYQDGVFTEVSSGVTQVSTNAASASPTWTPLATGTSLPSGTQGQPLINTNGTTGYGTVALPVVASTFPGTAWTDKLVSAYNSSQCASTCTILIDDSIANDGHLTTPSVPSGVTVQFTGTGVFVACTINLGTMTKVFNNGAIIYESGSGCLGLNYTGTGPTLGASDHPMLKNIRMHCNAQTNSQGITINTTNGAMYDIDNADVSDCTTAGVYLEGVQFSHFRHMHLTNNYVNLKLYVLNNSEGGSSNTFDTLQASSPTSGVDVILYDGATTQGVGGNQFIDSTMQNASVVALAVIGSATCGSTCVNLLLTRGSPELNGGGASSVTIDGNVIPRAGALYESNAVVTWNSADVSDATATPEFLLNNSSQLTLYNPDGYGSSSGTIIQTDSTSSAQVIGVNNLYAAAKLCGGTGTCGVQASTEASPVFQFANGIPAISGTNYQAPVLDISCGNYWTGSATAQDCFTVQNSFNNGSNPFVDFKFGHSGSSGGNAIDFSSLGEVVFPGTGNPNISTTNWSTGNSNLTTAALFSGGATGFGAAQQNNSSACATSYAPTSVNTGSATTTTAITCLPANSVIDAVVYRVTTAITTAASFTVGQSGSTSQFCSTQSTLTLGATGICVPSAYAAQAAAADVVVTFNTTPGAGAMRIIVYYHTWTPPSS